MKVTKAQAQANRAHIVETAARLFQERGYDGVGVADLMAAAGFTHGGFYKHFKSKADLMAQAAACGLAQSIQASAASDPASFIARYLSREHRDAPGTGCTFAALSGDAARQSAELKATFAAGIERMLAQPAPADTTVDEAEWRAENIQRMAQMIGTLILSRACPDDSPLADEILQVGRNRALPPPAAGQ